MNKSIYGIDEKRTSIPFILLVLFGISFNQSLVVFGVNLSLSDLFLAIIFIFLLINKRIRVFKFGILFFLIVIINLLLGTLYSAIFLNVSNTEIVVIRELLKSIVLFIYFIIGASFEQRELNKVTTSMAYTAFTIIFISALALFLRIDYLLMILSRDGFRISGFLNDPNLFSILIVISLCILLLERAHSSFIFRGALILMSIIGIIVSSSKTGAITVVVYFAFLSFSHIRKSLSRTLWSVFFITLLCLLSVYVTNTYALELIKMGAKVPQFGRVLEVFTNFYNTLAFSESSRTGSWINALRIIQLSPIIGVGVGTFQMIGIEFFNYAAIAHNTYLQLFAEWGIPLAIVFFIYVFNIIFNAYSKSKNEFEKVLSVSVGIMLFGSLAISLNNMRLFWLFLGFLVARHYFRRYRYE